MYRAMSGSSLIVKEMFLSRSNSPLLPDLSELPIVALFGEDKTILFKSAAHTGNIPGEWVANVQIPLITVTDHSEFPLMWRFKDTKGNLHHIKDTVLLSPTDQRDSESVIMTTDLSFTTCVPFSISQSENVSAVLYKNNEAVLHWREDIPGFEPRLIYSSAYKTSLELPCQYITEITSTGSLTPFMLIVTNTETNDKSVTWLYVINPSILSATMMVEEFVNKARIKNIIPELDFKLSDFLLSLNRGLALFNSYPPIVSGFDGTAMAGSLLDSWITCSCHCLLSSQIQAEGASSFDFSGQSVSLNMDRTSVIEGTLSRLENTLDNVVKPFKKQLIKSGVTGGSGNISGTLSYGRAFGRVLLTNNPISAAKGFGASYGNRVNSSFIRRGIF